MRAVILAAGRATRLLPLTERTPKCLLEVGGRPIIFRSIEALLEHGMNEITIVDGFEGDLIRNALKSVYPTTHISFVRNEMWASTNNAYSLHLALRQPDEPMILLDADIVFDPKVIETMLSVPWEASLALRKSNSLGEEEMKVALDEGGYVADISKSISPDRAAGESVGIEIFSAESTQRLHQILDRSLKTSEGRNDWYETAFVEMIRSGVKIRPVDLRDLCCVEVDTAEDLAHARWEFG